METPPANTPPAQRPDYIPEKFWKDGPDVENLAKSYVQLEAAYRSRKPVDLPESPEGYQLKPEQLPEGITWSDDAASKFATVFHSNGIAPGQARAITDAFLELEAQNNAAIQQAYEKQIEEGTAALKQEWGANYDKNISSIKSTVERLGFDPEDQSLFGNPTVIRFLGKVVSGLSEDTIAAAGKGASAPGSQFVKGEEEAKRIMSDPSHPDHEAYLSGNVDVVQKVMRLLGAK